MLRKAGSLALTRRSSLWDLVRSGEMSAPGQLTAITTMTWVSGLPGASSGPPASALVIKGPPHGLSDRRWSVSSVAWTSGG